MKKIFFLLLITIPGYSQTLQNPTYGKVKLKTNLATASTSKIVSQDSITGDLNYIDAVNLPVSTSVRDSLNAIPLNKSLYPAKIVVSDGAYNAFPSIEKLTNGNLITVYRKGVTHLTFDGAIILKRSTDKGKTWPSESVVIANTAGHDYRDPSISILDNGNLILSYFDRITDTNRLIYTAISTDGGITFSIPVQLTGYANYGSVSSKVIQLGNGDLLLSTYGRSGANGLLNIFKSTTAGASWSVLSTISTDAFGSALKYAEPNLVLLPDGDIVASIRNDSTFKIAFSTSTDSGVTWSTVTDNFDSNSRGVMGIMNNKLIITYRTNSGNSALRYAAVGSTSFSNEVLLSVNAFGEQDEYSSFVINDNYNLYFINALQNSAATSSSIYFRYLNDPISLGTIPLIQTQGLISKGASTFETHLNANNIKGFSGDLIIETNTSSTARGIILKTANLERFKILGDGKIGIGLTPTQSLDVLGSVKASTSFITPFINSGSSAGILKLVGGGVNYGGSIDVVGTSFGSNNGGINFRAGIISGESPVIASFNSVGVFNVVGNITAASYSGAATLTGNPTAPTPTAGDSDTSIATTAFVQANSRPYKSYVALLSQTGTSAPVATVLENTLGGTVVWTRNSIGDYSGTLTGAFTLDKTTCDISLSTNVTGLRLAGANRFDNNTVKIYSSNLAGAGVPLDIAATLAYFEIRVYP